MEYLRFIIENWRYLAFGSLLTCLAAVGSGYFVGLFGRDFREEFGLSHADLGLILSVTTLAGGPLLMWLGRKIDDVDLRLYSIAVCAGVGPAVFCWRPLLPSSLSVSGYFSCVSWVTGSSSTRRSPAWHVISVLTAARP